jgi:predicted metal-dependent HD superfamily phosphohydrolase
LGSPGDLYVQYYKQIREEYSHLSNESYFAGRRENLEQLLKSNYLYKADIFIEKYEASVRRNILSEIRHIKA